MMNSFRFVCLEISPSLLMITLQVGVLLVGNIFLPALSICHATHLKLWRYIQYSGTSKLSPTGPQSQRIWTYLLGSSHKSQGYKQIHKLLFCVILTSWSKAECMCQDGIRRLGFFRAALLASECLTNLKPDPKPETPGQAKRPLSQKDLEVCLLLLSMKCLRNGSLSRTISLIATVPWDPGIQALLVPRVTRHKNQGTRYM